MPRKRQAEKVTLHIKDKTIVVARIKDEIVCRRLVISNTHMLLAPDNHCPDNEIITSDQRIVEIGEETEILGQVKQLERWLIEDAEILGRVVGQYKLFVPPTRSEG